MGKMEILWSPWRSKYIGTFKDECADKDKGCFICDALKQNDDKQNLIVFRTRNCVIMLNKYPYNNGHILLAPKSHEDNILKLSDEVELEMVKLRKMIIHGLEDIYKPHGFNIGANLGRAAGAGLPGHLHFHIIPRWVGDTSFTAVFSDVKVVSVSLEETYTQLRESLIKMDIEKFK